MEPGLPLATSEAPRTMFARTLAFDKNPAFKMVWKACTGFLIGGLTGAMTWKGVGVACGVAIIASSWELFFGPDPIEEIKTTPGD